MACNNARKGQRYEERLATLFLIRATQLGHQFEILMGNEDLGGKFDDLIFRYLTSGEQKWRYRYLQAKHKANSNEKIKASHLIDDLGGDFSLPKYFRSYCRMVDRGDDLHDCIIITNIDFDVKDLEKNGITIQQLSDQDDILHFRGFSGNRTPYHCKLKFKSDVDLQDKLTQWSEIQILAEKLREFAINKKTIDLRLEIFKNFHVALVTEKVIDKDIKKFHRQFIDEIDSNLTTGAQALRQTLRQLFQDDWTSWSFLVTDKFGKGTVQLLPKTNRDEMEKFFDKLVFIVNSPNEEDFDQLFKKDLDQLYPETETKNQTMSVVNDIELWVTNPKRKIDDCLTTAFGRKVLLSGVDEASAKIIKELIEQSIAFDTTVIQQKAETIKNKMNDKQTIRITSLSPDWSAVKVIAALQLMENSQLWVTKSNQMTNQMSLWTNRITLAAENEYQHYLIIVSDQNPLENTESLLVNNNRFKIVEIFSSSNQTPNGDFHDEFRFKDLKETTREVLLSRNVNDRQQIGASNSTIADFIPEDLELQNQIIDPLSIQELGDANVSIRLPLMDTTGYDEDVYINRDLFFPLRDWITRNSAAEVNKFISIDEKGKMKWKTEDEDEKFKVWKKLTGQVDNFVSGQYVQLLTEDELIQLDGNRVIIAGVAGTGKSTLLSSLCHKIKRISNRNLIIKINLVEKLFKNVDEKQTKADEFFFNLIKDELGPFVRSFIKYRLTNGEQIYLFLDGFDEIGDNSENVLINFINNLNDSVRIYITTRSHEADKLQFEMGQSAFNLVPFSQGNQIDFLVRKWQQDEEISKIDPDILKEFATELVAKTGKALKREENESFIGIPLQCRILGESFQLEIFKLIEEIKGDQLELKQKLIKLIQRKTFHLSQLFQHLIETKRKIFNQDKVKLGKKVIDFHGITYTDLERYLTKLALKVIVHDKNEMDLLWPPTSHQSIKKKREEENRMIALAIRYGFISTPIESDEIQFIHRTYAEFLFADFIYNGLLIDEEDSNGLLESEHVREWIVRRLLTRNEYNGICTFIGSMLNDGRVSADLLAKIGEENVPKRYTALTTCLLAFQFKRKPKSSRSDRKLERKDHWQSEKMAKKHPKIFEFVFCCLVHCGNRTDVVKFVAIHSKYYWFWMGLFQFDTVVVQRFLQFVGTSEENKLKQLFRSCYSELWEPKRTYSRNQFQRILLNAKEFLLFLKHSGKCAAQLSEFRQRILVREPDLFKLVFIDCQRFGDKLHNVFDLSNLQLAACDNDNVYMDRIHQLLIKEATNPSIRHVNIQKYKEVVMMVDKQRSSPLYMALLLNQQEISRSIVGFLQELMRMGKVSQEDLDNMCTKENGCLYCAYFDLKKIGDFAIYSLDDETRFLCLQFIEMCATEVTEMDDFIVNCMTNQETGGGLVTEDGIKDPCVIWSRHIENASELNENVSESSSESTDEEEEDSDDEIFNYFEKDSEEDVKIGNEETNFIDGFHSFWKSTKFMRHYSPERYDAFVTFITNSMWSHYVYQCYRKNWLSGGDRYSIIIFLYRVNKKLGHERMEKLVTVTWNQSELIDKILSNGKLELFEALIYNLNEEIQMEMRDRLLTEENIVAIRKRIGCIQILNVYFEIGIEGMKLVSSERSRITARLYAVNRFLSSMNEDELRHYDICLNTQLRYLLKDVFLRFLETGVVLGGAERFVQELEHFSSFLRATLLMRMRDVDGFAQRILYSRLSEAIKQRLNRIFLDGKIGNS